MWKGAEQQALDLLSRRKFERFANMIAEFTVTDNGRQPKNTLFQTLSSSKQLYVG